MPEFKGKLILITGAARGIGRAAAFEYAKAGARLIILDILGDVLEATAADLRREGYEVHAFQCDLASDTEVASLGEKIKNDIGLPDILHNNAFFARPGSILEIDIDGARKAFDISVLGYLRIVKAFVTEMIERKSGWIVNTASPNGVTPPRIFAANGVPYNMCKAADISISQSMAAVLKEHGIGVTILYPGAILSDASRQSTGKVTPEFEAAMKSSFMDNVVTPEVGVKGLIEGVRQGKFLASTFDNFEKILVEFAQNGLDPNVEGYSWPY
jgi:NAD(P)-dependent dehydrogenase (short-subunit alcohol dehydrogenase family)